MAESVLHLASVAIMSVLNVPALKGAYPSVGAGCVGGVFENVPQAAMFPFIWYEVSGRDIGGHGRAQDTEIALRLHVYSTSPGMSEAHRIMAKAGELLRYQSPSVSGIEIATIGRPDDEIPLPYEEINGVKCRELATNWRIFAFEALA